MKHSYIWDLDGTLLDSYQVIIKAAMISAGKSGIRDDEALIMRRVKRESLSAYLRDVSAASGANLESLLHRYRELSRSMADQITLIPGAEEVLKRLVDAGAEHFVYTHRGGSSKPILGRLGILHFFRDVVTSEYGPDRKRDSDKFQHFRGGVRMSGGDWQRLFHGGRRPGRAIQAESGSD